MTTRERLVFTSRRQAFNRILLSMNKEHQQEKRRFYKVLTCVFNAVILHSVVLTQGPPLPQASELLSSLREEQIEALLARTKERFFEAGEEVWSAGKRVDDLIFIKQVNHFHTPHLICTTHM
jgi:predicted methyltransferase